MAIQTLWQSGLTASTNPDPNTLGLVNPYPTPFTGNQNVTQAWTNQGVKVLTPNRTKDGGGMIPIPLAFKPSIAGATYTLTMWPFVRTGNGIWVPFENGNTKPYTGYKEDQIDNPDFDAIYCQVNEISSGTLAIYFDGSLALAQ